MDSEESDTPGEVIWMFLKLVFFFLKSIFLFLTGLFGPAGIIYFLFVGNYYAVAACIKMEFVSYYVARLLIAGMDGKLHEKYTACDLSCLFASSVVVGVLSYVGAVGYAALGGIYNQGFQMRNDGYYVCIIPCSMALLWSIVLAVDSRSCMKDVRKAQEDREVQYRTDQRRI